MKHKVTSQSGETILESLVSIILAVICIAMLATAVLAAARINTRVKTHMTEDLSFRYSEADGQRTQVEVRFDGAAAEAESAAVPVVLYESDQYRYYKTR